MNISLDINERLKEHQAEKAPKDEKDFYLKSYTLFSKLANYQHITSLLKQPVEDIIWEYNNLCLSYKPKSHWTKSWDLCQILYFSQNEPFDALLDWYNEYEADGSLESQIICGDWEQALEALNDGVLQQALADFRDGKHVYLNIDTLSPDVQHIGRMLIGDESAFTGSLGQRLLATIRFSRPGLPRNELHALAQRITVDSLNVDDYLWMGLVDSALSISNDLWLQTHLGHAFIALDLKPAQSFQLENQVIVDPVYLSIYEYVIEILKEGLWKEAVVYLGTCKEMGQTWIQKLFDVPEFKDLSDDYINTVLQVAVDCNLEQTQHFLHNILGNKHEKAGNIDQAVIEYAKACNVQDLDRLAHDNFRKYLENGVLKNVVTDMDQVAISAHYDFLVHYQKFRTRLNLKEFKEASAIFSHLLTLKDTFPDQFDIVLIVDNDLVLQEPGVYYSQEQCLNLIQLFKGMEKNESKREFAQTYYNRSNSNTLPVNTVCTKLRERLVYKAALSQTQ